MNWHLFAKARWRIKLYECLVGSNQYTKPQKDRILEKFLSFFKLSSDTCAGITFISYDVLLNFCNSHFCDKYEVSFFNKVGNFFWFITTIFKLFYRTSYWVLARSSEVLTQHVHARNSEETIQFFGKSFFCFALFPLALYFGKHEA